jgi:cytochrome c553
MTHRLLRSLLALTLLGTAPLAALAQTAVPDPQRGQQRYREVCGQCHELDPRRDRPQQAIGVPDGVRVALQTISPMRFLQTQVSERDIVDIQAWLDTFAPGTTGDIRDIRALSGSWYDPASSGQGFNLAVTQGNVLAVTFYGHRNNGNNLFLVGSTVHRPRYGEVFSIPLLAVEGGRFGGFDPAQIRRPPWGRVDLRFLDCRTAEATLDGVDGRQQLRLIQLTPLDDLSCD